MVPESVTPPCYCSDVEKTRSTSTSNFGTSRREGHDASAFYERFTKPNLSSDDVVNRIPQVILDDPAKLGDSRDGLKALPDNSVALVVTSPPYFVGKAYEEAIDNDAIPASYIEYLEMLHQVFAECVRVLEPGGRIAVNIANLGRKPYRSLSADVVRILQDELGLLLRGEILWQKGKTMSSSCAWGSFRSASNPVLRDVTERVIVACKGRFDRAPSVAERKLQDLPHKSTMANDEFVDVTRDVWEIDAESANRVGHPAPFPIELPRRLIDLYTYEGDIVVDPFVGAGSTLVAAERTGRHGLGWDLDQSYIDLSNARLDAERQRKDELPDYLDESGDLQLLSADQLDALTDGDRKEVFQAMAVKEGKKTHHIALRILKDAGFSVQEKVKIRGMGLRYDFLVTSADGSTQWYVDVTGAFTTSRPGLMRMDALWKMLGRLHVLHSSNGGRQKVIVLTSKAPRAKSEGDKALRLAGPKSVYDVVEMYDAAGIERLKAYAEGATGPLPGFWTEKDLGSV